MPPEILLNVLLILVLIGVNGWLAMAELALVSVRPTSLEAVPGKSAAGRWSSPAIRTGRWPPSRSASPWWPSSRAPSARRRSARS